MAEYERPILFSEDEFFDECNTGNGRLFCHGHGHNFDMIGSVEYLLLLC